jgi:hypothetical protein
MCSNQFPFSVFRRLQFESQHSKELLWSVAHAISSTQQLRHYLKIDNFFFLSGPLAVHWHFAIKFNISSWSGIVTQFGTEQNFIVHAVYYEDTKALCEKHLRPSVCDLVPVTMPSAGFSGHPVEFFAKIAKKREFRKNRCRESSTFLTGVEKITSTVTWNLMTFWKWKVPW